MRCTTSEIKLLIMSEQIELFCFTNPSKFVLIFHSPLFFSLSFDYQIYLSRSVK